jgi:hypothetical protein
LTKKVRAAGYGQGLLAGTVSVKAGPSAQSKKQTNVKTTILNIKISTYGVSEHSI